MEVTLDARTGRGTTVSIAKSLWLKFRFDNAWKTSRPAPARITLQSTRRTCRLDAAPALLPSPPLPLATSRRVRRVAPKVSRQPQPQRPQNLPHGSHRRPRHDHPLSRTPAVPLGRFMAQPEATPQRPVAAHRLTTPELLLVTAPSPSAVPNLPFDWPQEGCLAPLLCRAT